MKPNPQRLKNTTLITCLMLAGFCLGVFAQEQAKSSRLKAIYVKGKWGYAEQTGKVVIAPQFDAARPFNNGLAQVGVLDEELPEINSHPNLKWGLIDESGRVLVELRYAQIRPFTEGLAAVAMPDPDKSKSHLDLFPNLKWGYVDRQGRIAIPLQFAGAGNFSEGLASVNVDSGGDSFCGRAHKSGYIDATGKFVIQPQFASAAPFKNGRAEVPLAWSVTWEDAFVARQSSLANMATLIRMEYLLRIQPVRIPAMKFMVGRIKCAPKKSWQP